MYKPIKPDWYYSYVDIPNWKAIQEELIGVLADSPRNYLNGTYFNVSGVEGLMRCPKLAIFFVKHGMLSRVKSFLFSKDYANDADIHIDSYDPTQCQMSLNFPLVEYENSYTCWYSTDVEELQVESRGGLSIANSYAVCPRDKAVEIKRVETVRPMLINTTILHAAEASSRQRALVGVRFVSPLTEEECRKIGIKAPYVQQD